MIAEVIVDIAAGETDRIYDYLCDDDIKAGSRVRAPFGGKIVSGFVMRLKETSDVPPGRLKRVFPCSDGLPALNPECLALAGKLTARYRVPMALSLRLFLPSEMRAGKVRELKKNYASLLVPLSEMSLSKTAKNQRGAAEYLEKNGKTECGFLNGLFPGGVAALEKKGYALVKKEQLLRDPYKGLEVEHFDRELTEDQRRAVERIERDERTVQLLHGVTGSGKTEIYLTLIAKLDFSRARDFADAADALAAARAVRPQRRNYAQRAFGGRKVRRVVAPAHGGSENRHRSAERGVYAA